MTRTMLMLQFDAASRAGFLLGLIGCELLGLRAFFAVPCLYTPAPSIVTTLDWPVLLLHGARDVWKLTLAIAVSCVAVLWPRAESIIHRLHRASVDRRTGPALSLHLLSFAALWFATTMIFGDPYRVTGDAAFAGVLWYSLVALTLASWLNAIAPARSLMEVVRGHRMQVSLGIGLGFSAWLLLRMFERQQAPLAQQELWSALSNATLWMVQALVRLLYGEVVFDPAANLVGTPSFHVEVSYACSGIEGISLMTIFLVLYGWLYRQELRFPYVLVLIPLGATAIWLANAVRITALIVVGSSVSREIAIDGFHAQAGWIAFTVIALGAIVMTHRTRLFTRSTWSSPRIDEPAQLASALLAPFLVQLAATMLTSAMSNGFDALYPLRVLATGGTLVVFASRYRNLGWSVSPEAFGFGIAAFLIWMILDPGASGTPTRVQQSIEALPSWASASWIAARVVGATITVPLAEELAFRVYLLRKLTAMDFENVAPRAFNWVAFAGSSVLFGLLHGDRWLAATLAGSAFALALRRRGQIGDAVVAHATTNGAIALVVLLNGRWDLWGA
ncbi:MAG: exosortase E/protease, VPEID-CTERM system [Methylotetracoccus sp.]